MLTPMATTNATGNTNGKTRVKRGAQKPPDHPLKSVNEQIKTVTGAVNNFQKSVLTSLTNFFTYLTKTAHLKFLSSTKNGLDTINGWVTKVTDPVNTYIGKIKDWGSRSTSHT